MPEKKPRNTRGCTVGGREYSNIKLAAATEGLNYEGLKRALAIGRPYYRDWRIAYITTAAREDDFMPSIFPRIDQRIERAARIRTDGQLLSRVEIAL